MASNSGDHVCNWCAWHHLACMWPDPNSYQKMCEACIGQKLVCIINRVQVSKRKWRELKERSGQKWKMMRVEMVSELESYGSGEDGWRVWGLHDIAFDLLGLQSNL